VKGIYASIHAWSRASDRQILPKRTGSVCRSADCRLVLVRRHETERASAFARATLAAEPVCVVRASRAGRRCQSKLASGMAVARPCFLNAVCHGRNEVMLPTLFSSTTIPALGEVVNFAQARHTVLAGNVVNVNTPGYRLRDLSQTAFQEKLKEAIELTQTSTRSMSPGLARSEANDPLRQVRKSLENILYHDDTNIDLEKQITEITKNQILHNFALTVMTDQFRLLEAAISERV
jgi:flagellar basal-body rod protein FlgB